MQIIGCTSCGQDHCVDTYETNLYSITDAIVKKVENFKCPVTSEIVSVLHKVNEEPLEYTSLSPADKTIEKLAEIMRQHGFYFEIAEDTDDLAYKKYSLTIWEV